MSVLMKYPNINKMVLDWLATFMIQLSNDVKVITGIHKVYNYMLVNTYLNIFSMKH